MAPSDAEQLPINRFPVAAPAQTTQVSRLIEFGPWTRSAQNRVRALADLLSGWDGKNSPPIQDNAKRQVFGVIDALTKLQMPAPHIVPVPGGGLQFEWHTSINELEIEIAPDGTMGFLAVDSEGSMLAGDISGTLNHASLTPLSAWFLEQKHRVCDLVPYAP